MTREEAIKILSGAIKKPNTKDGYLGQALSMAIAALSEQRTGRWEWTDGDERIMKASFYTKWTCTSCGGKRPEKTKYCPICGAKMKEQEERRHK